jgi:hypothetical protein
MRARPSSDLGPVERPPWNRQRRLPGSTFTLHGLPWRFCAPHAGRCFCGSGSRLPERPRACRSIRTHPALVVTARMLELRSGAADETMAMPIGPSFEGDTAVRRWAARDPLSVPAQPFAHAPSLGGWSFVSPYAAALAPSPSKGCRIAPTCTCVHTPPRAVRTLRSLSFAAMALWLVAPARMISSMMGRTLAANRLAFRFTATSVNSATTSCTSRLLSSSSRVFRGTAPRPRHSRTAAERPLNPLADCSVLATDEIGQTP